MVGEGRTNGVPVPTEVPPQLPVNHSTVCPKPPVRDSEILPASSAQKLLRSVAAEVGAWGAGRTVTTHV